MSEVAKLIQDIEAETNRIWLTEPEEVRAARLGVFTSGAGTNGQYFSNLVFINGDMRALATWITPSVIINAVADDSFSLAQCQQLFAWTNLVNVDFLVYCGFVKFGDFAHRIIECYEEMKSKEEFQAVLTAWYAYANRLYLWVHQTFPWGLGVAFQKPTVDDLAFIGAAITDPAVATYFERHEHPLNDYVVAGSVAALHRQ